MDKKGLKRAFTKALPGIIVAAFAILLYVFFMKFSSIRHIVGVIFTALSPIIIGMGVAYLLTGPLRFFERKVLHKIPFKKAKSRRGWAILLSYLTAFAVIFLLGAFLIPQLISSITMLINNLSGYQKSFEEFISFITDRYTFLGPPLKSFSDSIQHTILNIGTYITDALPAVFSISKQITQTVFNILMGLFVSVYILIDMDNLIARFKKVVFAFIPQRPARKFLGLLSSSNYTFLGYINGKILDSAIIGVLCYICMIILRLEYALLISVVGGVFNVIPVFGPIIGAIPGAIILLIADPIQCLWFLIMILILQQLDGNFIGPTILGDRTGLSSFWVIFAITFFGALWGFWGMLLGVPIFAVLYSISKSAVELILERKGLPKDTSSYLSNAQIIEQSERAESEQNEKDEEDY